jgi:hypothetical protein
MVQAVQHIGTLMAHTHTPGLVLRLDPDALLNEGARCSCDLDLAVKAQHFFLCIASDAKEAFWVPLFTGPRVGSREIPSSAKTGHPRWSTGSSHYAPDQIWRASHKATQRAANVAHDQTTPKTANTVAAPAVPRREDFPQEVNTGLR